MRFTGKNLCPAGSIFTSWSCSGNAPSGQTNEYSGIGTCCRWVCPADKPEVGISHALWKTNRSQSVLTGFSLQPFWLLSYFYLCKTCGFLDHPTDFSWTFHQVFWSLVKRLCSAGAKKANINQPVRRGLLACSTLTICSWEDPTRWIQLDSPRSWNELHMCF